MGVEYSSEVEKRHVAQERGKTWEYYSGPSLVEAVRDARDRGWEIKKVQVRYVRQEDNMVTYYVEPYEEGCGCKGLLKFKDFY
jgi:hypothetical protein